MCVTDRQTNIEKNDMFPTFRWWNLFHDMYGTSCNGISF